MTKDEQEKMLDNNTICADARKTLGFTQSEFSAHVDKSRSVIGKIESGDVKPVGMIVPISLFIKKMTIAGPGMIEASEIINALNSIPESRRGAWSAYNSLIYLCYKNKRVDIVKEISAIDIDNDEVDAATGGENVSVARHQVEDLKAFLARWSKTTGAAKGELSQAIVAATTLGAWVEQALEREAEANKDGEG